MERKSQLLEARKTIEQEIVFVSPGDSQDHWFSALSFRINELIQHDFSKLLFLLYRLDVDELKLKQLLNGNPGSDASNIIANLIVDRQLQKIKTREAFRKDNNGIDENDKW